MISKLFHREQSRVYLGQANQAFADGDLFQASEKGWGAASQIIKALAEEREWEHWSHWRLSGAVSRVVEETGDLEFGTLYAQANVIHVNFYECDLSATLVEHALRDVARFVDKVEALLDGGA